MALALEDATSTQPCDSVREAFTYQNLTFLELRLQHVLHNHTINPPVAARHHDMNIVGVLIHIFGDAVNSQFNSPTADLCLTTYIDIAVIISAVIIWKLHSPYRFYADPAVSLAISLIIFASAIPMSRYWSSKTFRHC